MKLEKSKSRNCCRFALAAGRIPPAVYKSVPAFADAVTLATENKKSAFDVVEQQYENIQAERIMVNYDKQGFNPNMVQQFLGPEHLEVRLASTLSEVSGDKQLDQFDDKTRALGSSLQALTGAAAFQRLAASSATDANIAATAVNALGRWFIERKRQQRLPRLIDERQEPVKGTAERLEADIGNAPDPQGHGGRGLRDQLWDECSETMIQQATFIDHNNDKMDPASKAEAIRNLPLLVRQRSIADQGVKETQATLSKLVEAHSALQRAVHSKADVRSAFSALIAEDQRIKSFFDSVQKKG